MAHNPASDVETPEDRGSCSAEDGGAHIRQASYKGLESTPHLQARTLSHYLGAFLLRLRDLLARINVRS